MRRGQHFRFFRDEAINTLLQPDGDTTGNDEEPVDEVEGGRDMTGATIDYDR